MRILHILDHSIPLHSGYTFRTLGILNQQRALGWETFHLTSPKQKSGVDLEADVDGWHFFRTPQYEGSMSRLPGLDQFRSMQQTSRRLDEVVRRIKPQILHAHSPVLNAFPALSVGRRHGIPVVYEVRAFWEDAAVDHQTTTEGSPRYRITRWMETRALRRADAVTTICEGLRSDIIRRGVAADKITVIPNAVDIDQFQVGAVDDGDIRRNLGLDGKLVVGFIGSFYAYEGLDLLVDALPLVLERAPNVRLLLVGGGPQEQNLKRQVQALGLENKVIFAGRVPHQQVSNYYAVIDMLAYPRHSMRLTELVTPLKPLEAMAQGKIVIASDVGGHKELIRDGETGWLFKAGDKVDLAEKIARTAGAAENWGSMQIAGRRFVEAERSWRASVQRYDKIYQTILARRPIA